MKIYYCDQFVLPLPDGHRFPMSKYALLRERVAATGDDRFELCVPPAATDEQLLLAHDADYLDQVVNGTLDPKAVRALGFPWSPQLVERSRRSVGATIAAARAALDDGYAANLAGGTHHAFADRPQGFCVFNDSAVAARTLQRETGIGRVIIIDCDVHQGNGTAAILANDDSIFTLSLHGRKNFPFHKESSDLDVELDDGTGDDEYLARLDQALSEALPKARAELAIYLAGADPFAGDRLGRLQLSKQGLAERDRQVFDYCERYGLPVAVAMAGGYAEPVEAIVDIHFRTVSEAARRSALQPAGD